MMLIRCPECRQKYSVKDSAVGKYITCAKCDYKFKVAVGAPTETNKTKPDSSPVFEREFSTADMKRHDQSVKERRHVPETNDPPQPPTKEKHDYFYFSLGFPQGPYSWEQLVDFVVDGTIHANTSCMKNDDPSRPAEEFFGDLWKKIKDSKIEKIRAANRKKDAERIKPTFGRKLAAVLCYFLAFLGFFMVAKTEIQKWFVMGGDPPIENTLIFWISIGWAAAFMFAAIKLWPAKFWDDIPEV